MDLTSRWGEGMGKLVQALSPLHHISNRTPPILLIHGDADSVVASGRVVCFTGV